MFFHGYKHLDASGFTQKKRMRIKSCWIESLTEVRELHVILAGVNMLELGERVEGTRSHVLVHLMLGQAPRLMHIAD